MERPSGATLTAVPPPPDPPGRRRSHRRLAVIALVVLVLSAAMVLIVQRRGGSPDAVGGTAAILGPSATPAATPAPRVTATTTTSAPVAAQPESSAQPSAPTKTWWQPRAGLTWQWQLSVPVDQSVEADVYDIDMFENDAAVVASLHAAGRRVICYIDVGGWENYRSDASAFPDSVLGDTIDGWPDERWLDIRQLDVLRPIMAARFDLCAQRGFDGVEPDLVDAASAKTGFPLTADDQLRYNLMIAELAHERGLAVGLKNDLTQIPQLVGTFDFSVNEQCAEYSECEMLTPFIAAGKPVFHAEYDVPTSAFCEQTTSLGFSSIRKKLDLGAWLETC